MDEAEIQGLRQRIAEFLEERLESKLNGLRDDTPDRAAKEQKLRDKYHRETWIADAARRASKPTKGRLQVVTHPAKATHPSNLATSLNIAPFNLPNHPLVGSHILGEDFVTDVAGDAADLDIFPFLQIEHDGRTLLNRAINAEPELACAFSDDFEQGMEWVRCFAGIIQPQKIKADPRGKQIYWLVDEDPTRDGDFHLLSPLYSSVLAHRIHAAISETRFSDTSKAARKAHWDGEYSEHEHREYFNLAEQRLGGSNAQNVSKRNQERGGTTYLLASLPPNWRSAEVRPPLHTESVFRVFGRRRSVRQTLRDLERFLEANPRPNKETREHRDALVAALVDELLMFAAELQGLEPGWSADPACQIPEEEALWLDPDRAEGDPDFAHKRETTAWAAEVRERFAAWLNHRLVQKLPVGDEAHRHWEEQLEQETAALEEILSHA